MSLKIGLLSDTHGRVELASSALEQLIKSGAKYLLHAGDIGSVKVLELMCESGVPYTSVLGNNDIFLVEQMQNYELFNEPHFFKIEELRCKLMHHPFYLTPDAELVVYGHLHKFEVNKNKKSIFINPGEVCARERGVSECAMLEVGECDMVLTYFFRPIELGYWHKMEYEYAR